MNRRIGTWGKILVSTMAFLIVFISIYSGYHVIDAARSLRNEKAEKEHTLPSELLQEAKAMTSSTASNTLKILEVVPYPGMAEIGYLIAGQEPIDLKKMNNINNTGITSYLGGMFSQRCTYIEKDKLDVVEQQENAKYHSWEDIYVATIDNGYFERSSDTSKVLYTKENWSHDSYVKTDNQTGQYKAVLTKLDFYSQTNGLKTSNKNVKAWFYNKNDPVSSRTTRFGTEEYVVRNAKENPSHTGDYDYNLYEDVFYLNKGAGGYDVEFMPVGYKVDFGKKYFMSADYTIVDDCSGTYTGLINYQAVTKGDYKKVSVDEDYSLTAGGGETYRWHSIKEGDTNGKECKPHIIYEKYKCHYGCEYVNMEWFKRFGMKLTADEIDDWAIEVITVTPSELSVELVDEVDLVFLSCNVQNRAYVGLWELYGKTKEKYRITDSNRYSDYRINEATGSVDNIANLKPGKSLPTFINNDMNWDVTYELFKRIGLDDQPLPAIFNSHIYETNQTELAGKTNSTSNNFAKLYIMLRQQSPSRFQKEYFDKKLIDVVPYKGVTTGSYNKKSGEAAYIWNSETFLPLVNGGIGPEDYYKNIGIDNYNLVGNKSVVGNIYTFVNDCIIDGSFTTVNPELSSPWYREVQKYIFEENNGYEGTPSQIANQALAPNDIIDYLLRDLKNSFKLTNLRVLDLEPCNDYQLEESDVRAMVKNYSGPIKIVHMTTAEFNGGIEDLNSSYDMIYMGLQDGMFNKDGDQIVYNDSKLNHKVYLHVGDKIVGGVNLKGLSSKDSNLYRFSGNDITLRKQKQLEEFLTAGFPIVAHKDLYALNEIKIDKSSRIYSFIKDNKGDAKNSPKNVNDLNNLLNEELFKTHKSIIDAKLKECLKQEKPIIDFNEGYKPVSYDGNQPNKLQLENRLKYSFNIKQDVIKEADAKKLRYTVKLYIDHDANGIFDNNKKELLVELKNQVIDNAITIDKELPNNCYGFIPWKLEVIREDQPLIRSNEIGYYGCKSKLKKKLKILQITSTKLDGFDKTGSAVNLQDELDNKNGLFYKYAQNLNDFEFDITTIDVTQFEAKYKNTSADSHNNYIRTSALSTNHLKEYDMVVLGFGDYYTNISNDNGAVDNLYDYMESGKCVLFTNDTTSIVNKKSNQLEYTKGVANWGYSINQYLRNRIGLNRFGVETLATKSVNPYSSFFDNAAGKDIPTSPYGENYKETQGYTYKALCQYAMTPADKQNASSYPDKPQYGPYKTIGITNSLNLNTVDYDTYNTNSITDVNDGQITRYPYDIPKAKNNTVPSGYEKTCGFKISNSHGQYYELDLEDPQMVVWYCLSNEKKNDFYSSSPNDVRNNYYIYNKGNITYTGVGTKDFKTKMDGRANEYEVKLFINTMIAAYMASNSSPDIVLPDGVEKSNEESIVYMNSDYNKRNEIVANEDFITIRFYVKDDEDLAGKAIITCYDENSNKLNLTIFDAENKKIPGNEVNTHKDTKTGDYTMYYFKYSKSNLKDENQNDKESTKILIKATNSAGYTGKEVVTLLRRNLFNLN